MSFSRRETFILLLLGIAVLVAVTYGVVTYQTPYGCDSNGVAQGTGIDGEVLAKPCIYVYFTGIVGGSTLLILLLPVTEIEPNSSTTATVVSNGIIPANLGSLRS